MDQQWDMEMDSFVSTYALQSDCRRCNAEHHSVQLSLKVTHVFDIQCMPMHYSILAYNAFCLDLQSTSR